MSDGSPDGRESLPDFYDPQVQIVYDILCDAEMPGNDDEHWEGRVARRIVAALRAADA